MTDDRDRPVETQRVESTDRVLGEGAASERPSVPGARSVAGRIESDRVIPRGEPRQLRKGKRGIRVAVQRERDRAGLVSERRGRCRRLNHKGILLRLHRWLPDQLLVAVMDGDFVALTLLDAISPHMIAITRLRLDARLFNSPQDPPLTLRQGGTRDGRPSKYRS